MMYWEWENPLARTKYSIHMTLLVSVHGDTGYSYNNTAFVHTHEGDTTIVQSHVVDCKYTTSVSQVDYQGWYKNERGQSEVIHAIACPRSAAIP